MKNIANYLDDYIDEDYFVNHKNKISNKHKFNEDIEPMGKYIKKKNKKHNNKNEKFK